MISSGKTGEDDGDDDIGGWEFMTAALIQRNPNVVPLLEKKIRKLNATISGTYNL